MPPSSPGTGEGGAAITGNKSVEGSTGGLAEVTAAPQPSPEAITAPYDGAPASGSGSYQSLASLDVPSQCGIRREHPRVQLYQTKSPRSGRDQSQLLGKIEDGLRTGRVKGCTLEDGTQPDRPDEL